MPGPSISVSVPDASGVADELTALGPVVFERASLITSRYTAILEGGVRSRIRKGATGRVERSVTVSFIAGAGIATGSVWSNDPAMHRLEFGFVDADADGRHYHQPAFPAFRPAADTIEPTFVAAVDVGIAEVL
jgi:hypothetical protein